MFIRLSGDCHGKIQSMNNGCESLPNDLELLKTLVIHQREELALQQAHLEQKSDYINQLIEAIALARQQYFGSRGQKIDTESNQLSWLFNEAESIADHDAAESCQDDGKKKPAPPQTSNRRSQETSGSLPPYRSHSRPR